MKFKGGINSNQKLTKSKKSRNRTNPSRNTSLLMINPSRNTSLLMISSAPQKMAKHTRRIKRKKRKRMMKETEPWFQFLFRNRTEKDEEEMWMIKIMSLSNWNGGVKWSIIAKFCGTPYTYSLYCRWCLYHSLSTSSDFSFYLNEIHVLCCLSMRHAYKVGKQAVEKIIVK